MIIIVIVAVAFIVLILVYCLCEMSADCDKQTQEPDFYRPERFHKDVKKSENNQ